MLFHGALEAASSMRLGFVLLTLIAAYAVIGMTPIGLLLPKGIVPEWVRQKTAAQLPAFEMTPAMWFSAPLFRVLIAAMLINMLLATLTRVPRRWHALGTWATHLGIVVLALGGAWHAANKVEGELVVRRDAITAVRQPGEPLQTIFADDQRAMLMVWAPGVGELAIELPSGAAGLPRFNDAGTVWAQAGQQTMSRVVYDQAGVRVELTGYTSDARLALIEDQQGDRQWLPLPTSQLQEHPEWRGGYRASAIRVRIELPPITGSASANEQENASDIQSRTLSAWLSFASDLDAAVTRTTPDGRRVVLLYTAGGRVIEGAAIKLTNFTVEPFAGTDVPRDFAVELEVETQAGIERKTLSLNQPLIIREAETGVLNKLLATRRFTLSLQGWDDEGWFTDQRARFVVLKVSNAAGMPLIALGGWMIGLGVLWSIALRPAMRAIIRWHAGSDDPPPHPTTTIIPRRTNAHWGASAAGVLLGLTLIGTLALAARQPAITALDPQLVQTLQDRSAALIEEQGTRFTLETWLTQRGRFITDASRADSLALAAALWLDPAALIGRPVIAVPRGPLHAAMQASAGASAVTQPYRSGHRWPVEFVMEHLGQAIANGQADPRMIRDAELVLDRVETALALIDGPAFIEPPVISPWRAKLERLDDAQWLLWLIALLSVAWSIAALIRSGTPRPEPNNNTADQTLRIRNRLSPSLIAAAITSLALAAIIVRGIVAERMPMHNLHEALVLMVLLVAVGSVLAAWRSRVDRSSGVASASIAMAGVLALIAAGVPVPGALVEREAGILASADLLAWHVAIIIAGYAAVAVNAAMGLGWFIFRGARSSLTASMRRLTDVAFALLTVGIALGAWWAHSAWGRWWAFDPKETFSLILWLIVLVGVHVRAAEPRRLGVWLTGIALLALGAMVWNFVGVNLLLPGLHSYAS